MLFRIRDDADVDSSAPPPPPPPRNSIDERLPFLEPVQDEWESPLPELKKFPSVCPRTDLRFGFKESAFSSFFGRSENIE